MKTKPLPDISGEIPDGLYLGLPETAYFAQDALGTTDLSDLWLKGLGWWYASKHNPFAKPISTAGMAVGSATHCLLLEGEEALADRFAVAPNPNDYPNVLTSTAEIKATLLNLGFPTPRANAPKSEWVEMGKVYLSDYTIWDDIILRFQKKNANREIITAEDRFYLNIMHDLALDDPKMAIVCKAGGGVPLTEVSVFYTLPDGIRMRYRFDSLLPPCNADLKTLSNFQNKPVEEAIGVQIDKYALDVQAAMSFEARRWANHYISTGAVYGGSQEQIDWLSGFPALHPAGTDTPPYFIWLFIQKPDSSGTAPVLQPVIMNFGSAEHCDGFRKAMHGLRTYREGLQRFGLSKPWRQVMEVRTLQEGGPGSVSIPFWAKKPGPVPDESEALKW